MDSGTETTDLRFPIGTFQRAEVPLKPEQRAAFVQEIEQTPERVRSAVNGLTSEQLATPYRPGGWTVQQLIHHLADSHMNSYVRFKLALTEERPTIKPYDEKAWAELPDSRLPIEVSLTLLETLHARWVALLQSLGPTDWARVMVHPERGPLDLDQTLAIYAWHGKHHVAHVLELRKRMGW